MKIALFKNFNPALKTAIKEAFLLHWKRWLLVGLLVYLAPILEVCILAATYFIIDESRWKALTEKWPGLQQFILQFSGEDSSWLYSPWIPFLLVTGLIVVYAAVKVVHEKIASQIQASGFLVESRMLLENYFQQDLVSSKQLKPERFASNIIQNSGTASQILTEISLLLNSVFIIIMLAAGVLVQSWQIFLLAMGIFLLPNLINGRLFKKLFDIGRERVEHDQFLLGFFSDSLNSVERTKIDALEKDLLRLSQKELKVASALRSAKRENQLKVNITNDSITFIALASFLLVGKVFHVADTATLLLLIFIFGRMRGAFGSVNHAQVRMQALVPQLEQNLKMKGELRSSFSKQVSAGISPFDRSEPIRSLEMRDMGFEFEKGRPILSDLRLKISAGDRILIQGKSGEGKSTLIQLATGLLYPTSGAIYLNQQKLDSDLFLKMRSEIAYISPSVHLFDASLKENLLIGISEARHTFLNEALRRAQLQEVVQQLPHGVDTRIGRNGSRLSFGQRQRVIFARLFLKHPSLVILDEATSHLDSNTERQILSELEKFLDPSAIVIDVTHKPCPYIAYTRRYELKEGKLQERAFHEATSPSVS